MSALWEELQGRGQDVAMLNLTAFLVLVIWLVPWGLPHLNATVLCDTFHTELELGWVQPGVVVMVHPDWGVSRPPYDRWFVWSTAQVRYFLERGYRVWVFIDVERPGEWRGTYLSISLYTLEQVLRRLRTVIGEQDDKLVIGFTEFWLMDSAVKKQLYELVRKYFPRAKTFYGAFLCESPQWVLELSCVLKGYTLWHYVGLGTPHEVWVRHELAVTREVMFVPELGFRRDDRHAWVRAWDWRHVWWRDEIGDAVNYEATLRFLAQLARKHGVRHLVVGIWNWNQPEYGIALEDDVLRVLRSVLYSVNDDQQRTVETYLPYVTALLLLTVYVLVCVLVRRR